MNKSFGIVAPGTFAFTVTNVGDAPSRGPVVVSDGLEQLLPGSTIAVLDDGGFTCEPLTTSLRCGRSDSLAPGQSWVITAVISGVLPAFNMGRVDGGGDVNKSNNTDSIPLPQPDLAIEKQVTPDTVAPGEVVTYTLIVGNRSSVGTAGSVQLSDPLPAGLTPESVDAFDQGSCDPTVSCALGSLSPGGSGRVRVRARVGAQVAPGDVSNTATVNSATPDPSPDDNTDTGTFRIRRTAQFEASKQLEGRPTAGRPVRWTATVRNTGPHDSPGGDFVDQLPAVVEGGGATVPGGSCGVAGRLVSCTLPPIAAGGRVQIAVTGRLPSNAAARRLVNGIQIAPEVFRRPAPTPSLGPFGAIGPLPLPPAVGSSTPPGLVIRPAADVGVAKVATPDPLARNGVARWHVRTMNHGPFTATNVTIRDTLPAGARVVRSTGAGRCTVRGRVVRCRLGDLRRGSSVQTGIVARLGPGGRSGSLRNVIVADARQRDPAAANNRDRARSSLAPRLRLSKATGARTAERGDRLTYTLRLRNGGPSVARNVRLCDRPRRGLRITQAPGARRRGRAVCWTISRLTRGRTARRQVVARVTSAVRPRLTNVATVRVEGVRVARASRAVRVMRGLPPGVTG
jgi:uncharacterized repeat protein (TIGR01451 family)